MRLVSNVGEADSVPRSRGQVLGPIEGGDAEEHVFQGGLGLQWATRPSSGWVARAVEPTWVLTGVDMAGIKLSSEPSTGVMPWWAPMAW